MIKNTLFTVSYLGKKKQLFFLLFFVFFVGNTFAQQKGRIISMKEVHSIIVGEQNISFYNKNALGFTKFTLNITENNVENSIGAKKISIEIKNNNKTEKFIKDFLLEKQEVKPPVIDTFSAENRRDATIKDLENISVTLVEAPLSKKKIIIDVKDIKTQSVAIFLTDIGQKEWFIKVKGEEDKTRQVIKLFNPQIIMCQEIAFKKSDDVSWFFLPNKKNIRIIKNKKKWRTQQVNLYHYVVVNLAENKPILVYFTDNKVIGYIIPTQNDYILSVTDNYKQAKHDNNWSKDIKEIETITNDFRPAKFYNIKQINSKKIINDVFGHEIIVGEFDSIGVNKHFIITKNNGKMQFYNTLLEKISINDARVIYFREKKLEILQGNNVVYFDMKGQKPQNKSTISFGCGTVPHYTFQIDSITPKMTFLQGGSMHRRIRTLFFDNLTTDHKVTFLDKSRRLHYTGNDQFIEGKMVSPELLLVAKNSKYGVFEYGKKNLAFVDTDIEFWDYPTPNRRITKTDEELRKEYKTYFEQSANINVKELLPIIYDSIEDKNGLVILQKDKKFGVFPSQNTPKYQQISTRNGNFVRFEMPNMKVGWLDNVTGIEYFDK